MTMKRPMLPVEEYTEGHFIFMATANGTVKKTPLEAFSRQRSVGLIALELDEGDVLISAAITDGEREVMLFSDGGKVTRFKESDVRAMGRTARGVRGMRLPEGQKLISMLIPEEGSQILTASARGYGKRTAISEFPEYKRGGQGVIAMVSNERNGRLVGAVQVQDGEEIMLISDQGTLVRTRVDEVSSLGLGGAATWPQALRMRRVIADLPLSTIVLETDAPDMAPAMLANQRNSPQHLPAICQALAQVMGVSEEQLAEATTLNACEVFGWPQTCSR